MDRIASRSIQTDVLIIGGGIAGVFAAINARKEGVDVALVDKGTVGKSGKSPFFYGYTVFENSSDAEKQAIKEQWAKDAEYLIDQPYMDNLIDESSARRDDLLSWGLGGRPKKEFGPRFRKKVVESGVQLIERTMVTDLMVQDGHAIGAVGFSLDRDEMVIVHAKAVVMCAGSGAFKSPGYAICSLTHDGDAMAYRAGGEISGKEFVDFHTTGSKNPADLLSGWFDVSEAIILPLPGSDAARGAKPITPFLVDLCYPAHTGDINADSTGSDDRPGPGGPSRPGASGPKVWGATAGMAPHHSEGLFPRGSLCETAIPGLFGAGDALCTGGAHYALLGYGASGSATQGARAGTAAARFGQKTSRKTIGESRLQKIKAELFAPVLRDKGYSPAWVTQLLQNAMTPYYVLGIKSKERLEVALTTVTFLQKQFASSLKAKDLHELRLVHETKNMLLNAEMKLKASLFRTESRGSHYIEDYPARDDENWLAWVVIKQVNDEMVLFKEPIPEDWKPDPSIPYEERYPKRFPNEMEYLAKG